MVKKYKMNPRKQKGKTQNISVREVVYHTNKKREYVVSGTTNNYRVTISASPICTCPDHTSRNVRCKHIYFVLCKILKVEDYQEDQDTYSNTELEYMLNHQIVEQKINNSDEVNDIIITNDNNNVESKPGFFSRWFKIFK